MLKFGHSVAILALSLTLAGGSTTVFAGAGHTDDKGPHADSPTEMMKSMREQHKTHEHGHDFEAMDKLPPEQLERLILAMQEVGLVVPKMDAARGRKLFAETGCVVCHSVNKVGGEVGPSLNAGDLPSPMNAFEFAARMWRGAAAMTAMQEEAFGEVISLSGRDLADLIAFAHDNKEQKKLTENQVPKKFREMMKQ